MIRRYVIAMGAMLLSIGSAAAETMIPTGEAGRVQSVPQPGTFSYGVDLEKDHDYALISQDEHGYAGTVSLRRAGGAVLASEDLCQNDERICAVNFRAPYTGRYQVQVVVGAADGSWPTSFYVAVEGDCLAGIRSQCNLTDGQMSGGRLANFSGDTDAYRVRLRKGRVYQFARAPADGEYNLAYTDSILPMRLLDSRGRIVATEGYTSAFVEGGGVRAPADGYYWLVVPFSDYSPVIPYTVGFQLQPGR